MKAAGRSIVPLVALLASFALPERAYGLSYLTLDFPGAQSTELGRFDGSRVVGTYYDVNSVQRGFVYDGSSFVSISHPNATNFSLAGADNGKYVGSYLDSGFHRYGFAYDGTTFTPISHPSAVGPFASTTPKDISGNRVIGIWQVGTVNGGAGGFVFDGTTFQPVDYPGAGQFGSLPLGISGNYIVGYYNDSQAIAHGYTFDGSTYKSVDAPLGVKGTYLSGTDGTRSVGYYLDSSRNPHGLLYDGAALTYLDAPGSLKTQLSDIQGNMIAGTYWDATGQHGFVAVIPEPGGLLLASVGAIACFGWSLLRRGARGMRAG